MTQLSYSSKGGVLRFKATVEGQYIVDLEVFGDKEIEYSEDESGGGLQSLDSIRALMTHLSSAIADSAADPTGKGLKLHGVVFSFPPIAAVGRQRAIRLLDTYLEGIQLVVFDAALWLPSDFKFTCPKCNHQLTGFKGWGDATSSKGFGAVHTVYLASRVRICKKEGCHGCGRKTVEHTMLDQLPSGVRSLIPIFRTERSGLSVDLTSFILSHMQSGFAFEPLAKAVVGLTQARHAEQVLTLLRNCVTNMMDSNNVASHLCLQRLALYEQLGRSAKQLGQQRFMYPDLVQSETKVYKAYIRYVFLEAAKPILDIHFLLLSNYSTFIVKMDGGFKVSAALFDHLPQSPKPNCECRLRKTVASLWLEEKASSWAHG